MAISKEEEKVREKIARILVKVIKADRTGKQTEIDAVDQILKIDGIRIEAEEGQLSIPKPDSEGKVWVRCLWKEEK